MQTRRFETGSSTLETLVAIMVFSIGLVGIASILLTSMRNSDATLLRTRSTMLANEVYEMMLANLPAARAGEYNLAMSADLPEYSELDCATLEAACSPQQIAAWDLAMWGARVSRVLVKADAEISVDSSADPMAVQVSVRYRPLRGTPGKTTETFNFWVRE